MQSIAENGGAGRCIGMDWNGKANKRDGKEERGNEYDQEERSSELLRAGTAERGVQSRRISIA